MSPRVRAPCTASRIGAPSSRSASPSPSSSPASCPPASPPPHGPRPHARGTRRCWRRTRAVLTTRRAPHARPRRTCRSASRLSRTSPPPRAISGSTSAGAASSPCGMSTAPRRPTRATRSCGPSSPRAPSRRAGTTPRGAPPRACCHRARSPSRPRWATARGSGCCCCCSAARSLAWWACSCTRSTRAWRLWSPPPPTCIEPPRTCTCHVARMCTRMHVHACVGMC
mmetsp:Transcript_43394/g.119974  ORF Transcript_43394/g.119974 Transcript_43394/m.119974 type:complete len:226 (+) Transcript_43394:200-877(+)